MIISKYDKVVTGVILAVDPENSKCMVRIPEFTDEINATLTYPFISAFSGIRFMPREGDLALIEFSPEFEPRIVGFMADERCYSENLRLYREGSNWFRNLHSGEIVIYGGTGDSEIYISNQGCIRVSSGVNVVNIDSLRRMIESICGSFKLETLNGVTIKGGYASRMIPPGPLETVIPGAVELSAAINGLTGKIMEIKAGNVLNDLGIPEVDSTGTPKTISMKVFGGNTPVGEISLSPVSTGIIGALVTINGASISMSGNTSINGGVINISGETVSLTSPVVKLANPLSNNPAVRGNELVEILNSLIVQLIHLCSAVQAKSGQEGVLAEISGQLLDISTRISQIISGSVFLE